MDEYSGLYDITKGGLFDRLSRILKNSHCTASKILLNISPYHLSPHYIAALSLVDDENVEIQITTIYTINEEPEPDTFVHSSIGFGKQSQPKPMGGEQLQSEKLVELQRESELPCKEPIRLKQLSKTKFSTARKNSSKLSVEKSEQNFFVLAIAYADELVDEGALNTFYFLPEIPDWKKRKRKRRTNNFQYCFLMMTDRTNFTFNLNFFF